MDLVIDNGKMFVRKNRRWSPTWSLQINREKGRKIIVPGWYAVCGATKVAHFLDGNSDFPICNHRIFNCIREGGALDLIIPAPRTRHCQFCADRLARELAKKISHV